MCKRGSEWHKWDLHIHTASSYDYDYNSPDSDNILVDALIKNDVKAVAITDHFIIDKNRIENLRKLSEDKIVFFPGVELRTDKGNVNIHIILIFSNDCDLTTLEEDFNVFKRQCGKNLEDNEKIYWDFKDICDFANRQDALISIHAGSKNNGVDDRITNCLEIGQAIKEEYAKNVNIFEMGSLKDLEDYKSKVFPEIGIKPMVIGSDNHDCRKYSLEEKTTWIKSEISFEGLKQIMYEPEERVAIQVSNPNASKASYNIIDKIEFINSNDNSFSQGSIYFNENLNSIIGGKSTGKSLLLYYIAKEFIDKDDIFYDDKIVNELENKYDKYNVEVKVKWKDDNQNNKVIYLPQSYLERIFYTNSGNVEKIIEGYLCSKFKHINDAKSKFERRINENQIKINGIINDIRGLDDKILSYRQQIKEKGDVKVHETEIKRIKDALISTEHYNIDENNYAEFDELSANILKLDDEEKKISYKLELINSIDEFDISPYSSNNNELLDDLYFTEGFNDLKQTIEAYKQDIQNRWKDDKIKLISNISESLKKCKAELTEKSKEYNEMKEKINKISNFEEMQKKIDAEQKLLNEVTEYNAIVSKAIEERVKKLKQLEDCRIEYSKIAKDYKNIVENDKVVLSNSNNMKFVVNLQEKVLMADEINAFVNKRDTSSAYNGDNLNLCSHIEFESFINGLFDGQIVLKTGADKYGLLEKCYNLQFNLKYDVFLDDCSLLNSSEGRKAKILLDLIIDLSNEKYPILIDQPEDHLDNRTIYNDLVSYIKKIKKNRQLIVVTHNANVVIGADSEEIIIANQNGVGTENEHSKFEYRIGSIEDNTIENINSKSILKKEPFRVQMCNILEGGKEAFRQRENKYQMG